MNYFNLPSSHPGSLIYLEPSRRQSGVPFGQHTLHPQEERSFDLDRLADARLIVMTVLMLMMMMMVSGRRSGVAVIAV